ncbi:MAG: hypothetical protein ABJB66_02430 [Gemmatimonadaceae bacterium]
MSSSLTYLLTMMPYRFPVLAGLACFALPQLAAQSSSPTVQVHGFADWGVGHSDGGTFEFGSKRGTSSPGTFALVLSAVPAPRIALATQIGFNGLGEDRTEAKLDIVFAQYHFSDKFNFNVGRVKQPFGEYTEIFDVGTAHNMLGLPHGEYDDSGMMGEVYNGVGFTGGVFADSRWGLRYDGYVGDIALRVTRPWADQVESIKLLHEVIGARTIVETPVDGLSFGVSIYTGHLDDVNDPDSRERHTVVGAQADWANNRFGVRTEATRRQERNLSESSAYLEGTARLNPSWQLAARLDHSQAAGADFNGASSSLGQHTDIAIGLNYWFAPGFVLRAEFHDVAGNRFVVPLRPQDTGRRTHVVQFGSHFSF